MGEPGRAAVRRWIEHLGFVNPGPGVVRSRWARIVNVDRDSSRFEALAGLLIGVMLVVLVAFRVLSGPVWFRPIAAIAAVGLIGNLIRAAASRTRQR